MLVIWLNIQKKRISNNSIAISFVPYHLYRRYFLLSRKNWIYLLYNTISMVAIITGDIINSSKVDIDKWLPLLKATLLHFGKAPKQWDIYRGDSFQLKVDEPADALEVALIIKASVKTLRELDVRMSIGFGDITHDAFRITESNGTAFIHSGERFETLKKDKINLAVKSDWEHFDLDINMFLKLALLTMDQWTENSAEIVRLALLNPDKSQAELGSLVGIKQNTVSTRLKRSAFDEIQAMNVLYRKKIKEPK